MPDVRVAHADENPNFIPNEEEPNPDGPPVVPPDDDPGNDPLLPPAPIIPHQEPTPPPPPPPPPKDVCPNIPGAQETIPSGLIIDINGNCVKPAPIPLPPLVEQPPVIPPKEIPPQPPAPVVPGGQPSPAPVEVECPPELLAVSANPDPEHCEIKAELIEHDKKTTFAHVALAGQHKDIKGDTEKILDDTGDLKEGQDEILEAIEDIDDGGRDWTLYGVLGGLGALGLGGLYWINRTTRRGLERVGETFNQRFNQLEERLGLAPQPPAPQPEAPAVEEGREQAEAAAVAAPAPAEQEAAEPRPELTDEDRNLLAHVYTVITRELTDEQWQRVANEVGEERIGALKGLLRKFGEDVDELESVQTLMAVAALIKKLDEDEQEKIRLIAEQLGEQEETRGARRGQPRRRRR